MNNVMANSLKQDLANLVGTLEKENPREFPYQRKLMIIIAADMREQLRLIETITPEMVDDERAIAIATYTGGVRPLNFGGMIDSLLARIDQNVEILDNPLTTEETAENAIDELAHLELALQDYPDYRRSLKFGTPL